MNVIIKESPYYLGAHHIGAPKNVIVSDGPFLTSIYDWS